VATIVLPSEFESDTLGISYKRDENGLVVSAEKPFRDIPLNLTVQAMQISRLRWINTRGHALVREDGTSSFRFVSIPSGYLGSRFSREGPDIKEVNENPELKELREVHWVVHGVFEAFVNIHPLIHARQINHIFRGCPRDFVLEMFEEAELDEDHLEDLVRWKEIYSRTIKDGAYLRLFPLVSSNLKDSKEAPGIARFAGKIFPRKFGMYGAVSPAILDAHAFGALEKTPWEDVRDACAAVEGFIVKEFFQRGIKNPVNYVFLSENYVIKEKCSFDGKRTSWFFDINDGPGETSASLKIWRDEKHRLVALLDGECDPVPVQEARNMLFVLSAKESSEASVIKESSWHK